MKRYIFIDWLRGFAIYLVVIAHALLFNVFEGINDTLVNIPTYLKIFYLPVSVVLSSAGLFAFISGITNGTIIYSLLKSNQSSKSILKDSLISNSSLLVIHYLYLIFFTHSRAIEGVTYRSLVTGTFELNGEIPRLGLLMLYYNDALLMICMGGIISTVILIIFKKSVIDDRSNNIFYYLGGIGLFVVYCTPWLRVLLTPLFESALENRLYFSATILSWFVMPRHAILPYSFYSLFGAMLGLALVRGIKVVTIIKYLIAGSVLFFLSGLMAIFRLGIPDTNIPIYPINLYLLSLSFIFAFVAILLYRFEIPIIEEQKEMVEKTINFRRMGMIALTIYTLEGPLAALVALVFDSIFPNIVHNI